MGGRTVVGGGTVVGGVVVGGAVVGGAVVGGAVVGGVMTGGAVVVIGVTGLVGVMVLNIIVGAVEAAVMVGDDDPPD